MNSFLTQELSQYNGEYTNPRNVKTLAVPIAMFVLLYFYMQRGEQALVPVVLIYFFMALTIGWFFYLAYMYQFGKRYSNTMQGNGLAGNGDRLDQKRFVLSDFNEFEDNNRPGSASFNNMFSSYPRTDGLSEKSYEYAEKILGNGEEVYSRNTNKQVDF
jgi:hypothetical protein